jgi:hypothetical protein
VTVLSHLPGSPRESTDHTQSHVAAAPAQCLPSAVNLFPQQEQIPGWAGTSAVLRPPTATKIGPLRQRPSWLAEHPEVEVINRADAYANSRELHSTDENLPIA